MKSFQSKNITPSNFNNLSFLQKENSKTFFANNKPFFNASPVQTKLTINHPNDVYEKEADAMADKVVQRLSENKSEQAYTNGNPIQRKPVVNVTSVTPFVQAKCTSCEQEEKLQKKEEDDNLLDKKFQRKPIFESNAQPPDDEKTIRRKCDECEKEQKLQRKPNSSSTQTASPNIESNLNSSKGSGSPLPHNTREQMESSFGADFSGVKIHNDSSSVQMNKDLHAQAFTHGSDIYFNSGKYDTNSQPGKHLLAHELTHVVQQNSIINKKQIQRELIYGSGYPKPYSRDSREVDATQNNSWYPSSVDFAATSTGSGGGTGKATFADLLSFIQGKAPGSINELGLIGHSNNAAFGLKGTIIPNNVTFSIDGVISAGTIQANISQITRIKDRFASGAKIILYGCHAGAGDNLLNAISQAFQVCVAGFSDEVIWCLLFDLATKRITSRGKTYIDEAGFYAMGLASCANDFHSDIKQLTPQKTSCIGVPGQPPPTSAPPSMQRKCAGCEKEDEEKLQKKSEPSSYQSASSNIESSLNSSKSSGSPLPQNTREQMEDSFSTDFSNVRIHNDSSAVQMNKDLHAQAFTHGNDIYFNSGKYENNSTSGRHLLAHELTHVVQQKGNLSIQKKALSKKDILLRPNYELTLNKTHNDSEYKLFTTIKGKGKIWIKENTLTATQEPNQGNAYVIFNRQIKLEKENNSFYYIDYGGITTITPTTANAKEIERIKKLKGAPLLKATGNATNYYFNFSGSEISGRLVNAETSVSEEMAENLGHTSLQEVSNVFYGTNYIAQYHSLDEEYFNKAVDFAKKEAPGKQGMITSESQIDFANGTTPLAADFDQKGVARITEDDFKVKVLPLPVKDTGSGNEKFRLGFNEEVFILKKYNKNGEWFFIYTTDGRYGWVEHWGVAYGAPEKDALLYKVKKGDSLWEIAKGQPSYITWTAKPDEGFGKRTVINAIFFTNFLADRLLPFIGAVKSKISLKQASDSFQRLGENLKIRENSVIWLPSKSFVSLLISKGQISSGKLIDTVLQDIDEAIQDLKDFTIGVAGFLAGLVVGFVKSIVDLLTGIVDLVEMIAKAIWYIISGKLIRSIISFIKTIRNLTIDELKEFFTQAATKFVGAIKTIIGDFVKKWTEGSTWDRWYFRGKVFGYILAEIVLAILTSGTSLSKWLSKLGKVGSLIAEILLGRWDDVLLKLREAKGVERLGEGAKAAHAAKSAKLAEMTHEERKLLLNESSQAHKVAELEPKHLHAELDSAAEARIGKSARTDYEVEVTLDNGHKWRRNEKGTWCRFSEDSPTCILSRGDIPEATRAELEQLDKKAEEFKEAMGAENVLSKEDLDELAIAKNPPGSGKVNPRTTLGTFVHSKEYTKFCHWLDTSAGKKWLADNKLSHADFALNLPGGNIQREFAINHPDFKMKPRADVVDFDNAVIHEIKPKGLEAQGFVESQQYAEWMNKYHPLDDGRLWRAGPTISYDGQKVFDAFKKFGFFE